MCSTVGRFDSRFGCTRLLFFHKKDNGVSELSYNGTFRLGVMFQVKSAGLIESEIGVPCMKEKACIAQSIFPNRYVCKMFSQN